MNEFIDFSIQDELDYFEDSYENDHILDANMISCDQPINTLNKSQDESLTFKINNFNDEVFNPEGSFQQNVSPARATFEFPLGSSNLLGGQIFRKMAGITDKFNFNYANFSKLHSPRLDETSFMNPIKNCYDLGYMGLNHQKTYFANNPDSRQGSFSNLPKMSKLPGHEEEALRESIEQMRSSDENVKSTESKSNSTQLFSQSTMKLVNSSSLSFISDAYKINGECKLLNEQLSGFKRLKIPRLTDFQLYPSFTSKFSQNCVKTENQEKSDAVLKHEIKEPEQNLTAGYK